MTKIQWATLIAIAAYLVWEYVLLANWKATTDGPLIRVDLGLIYPVIIILAVISAWQLFSRRR